MQPSPHASHTFIAAFSEIVQRIASTLDNVPKRILPINMYVAGGAALHFYTGERVTRDIDASFSRRIALPADLEISYRDEDGPHLLYFDRQYNDTLGLLHEDAYDDSQSLSLPEVDAGIIDVRLLTPLDLAISKIGIFASQDRDDIATLARLHLINEKGLRTRATEAAIAYVGDVARLEGSINLACRLVADVARKEKSLKK